MKKIKEGDIFEIATETGKGYFQYIESGKLACELIRVFPKLFPKTNVDFDVEINADQYYFVRFPLVTALKKGIVNYVGNYNVPNNVVAPKEMITMDFLNNERNWYVINTDTLRQKKADRKLPETRKLSPFGIWNDTLLKLRIEQEWTPETWESFLD